MFAVGVQCGHFSLRPMMALPRKFVRFGAADADAVAQRASAGLDQIEPALGHVDHDVARLLLAVPGDLLAQAGRL